jgi:cob(I)alamin adenosyltransferase
MVVLNKIYTRGGDGGETALGDGERVSKTHARIEAYGTVDETNAVLGLVRLHATAPELRELDVILARLQNELFDLGADLCVPDRGKDLGFQPLRITAAQHQRLEQDIDQLNGTLKPLRSFVLPAGHAAAVHLHQARTVCRRAERQMVVLAREPGEIVSADALTYVNRLSDFLFVASRWVNARLGPGDVLWSPGQSREG